MPHKRFDESTKARAVRLSPGARLYYDHRRTAGANEPPRSPDEPDPLHAQHWCHSAGQRQHQGLQDPYRNPTTEEGFARHWGRTRGWPPASPTAQG